MKNLWKVIALAMPWVAVCVTAIFVGPEAGFVAVFAFFATWIIMNRIKKQEE